MKTHTKDYLNEFKTTQSSWLKNLIDEAINTNGNISDINLNNIYKLLKNEINEDEINQTTYTTNISNDILTINKLTHISGINALKNNQIIKFSKDCNILYGMNGSGKSSYFRILNEIVGGNEQKEILSNIYLDSPQPTSVNIDYTLGSNSNQLNWNNTSRSISPFHIVRVFDSSYLNGLLSKREVDSTLVEPFGLNLFSYIIDTIDKFKKKLSDEMQIINNKKPNINNEKFSLQFKSLFEQNFLNDTQQKTIENKYDFSDEDNKKLNNLKTEYQNLSQQNIQDKIKLETAKYNEINTIKKLIEDVSKNINPYIEKVKNALDLYKKYELESNEFKKQIEVLKTLPSTNSDKWKSFITSASIYSKDVEDSDKTCIYCRQPLDNTALDIVQAYSKYLNNESEVQLNNTSKNIQTINKAIEQINFIPQINQEIKSLFKATLMTNESRTICKSTIEFHKQFNQLKNDLITSLSNKVLNENLTLLNYSDLVSNIDDILKNINANIIKLKSDDETKEEELKKLGNSIAPLEEHKSISEQKEQIQKWIILGKQIQLLNTKTNTINTRALSTLSKEAHDNLLTENLKNKFEEELQAIGFKNLKVNLENAGVSKGKSQTKLSLHKTNKISSILSEGEQKAVALSIFIAEARMQSQNNPIIFDDPVNSLDHRIASNFAKRLLELDNQIIVFTHHKLFLDAFETANGSHICKNFMTNGCNKQGKHIFLHNIESEGKNSKGVISTRQEDKAETHFEKAKEYLNDSPFEKHNEVATKLRKTIECLVDEKVFNNQVPTKFTSKNNRIHWDSLKQLNNEDTLINTLREIHDRVSGGEMHNGTESNENPIEKEEFDEMVKNIESILGANNE